MKKSTGLQEPTVAELGQRSMEILNEKVNAHLPYYSTVKSSGMFSSKRFKLDCSSSVVVTQNQLRSQIYTGWSG